MNVLYCALDSNEFNRVSGCDTAKQIWDKLQVAHEGTNQVKENKISMLVHNYELLKMKPDENISSMFTRFTDIINGLKSLGKEYTNVEMVRKILRCLPKAWEPKVTAIQEAKDLTKLSLDELMGSLMSHEMNQVKGDEDEGKGKRGIALKASCSSDEEVANLCFMTTEDEDEVQDSLIQSFSFDELQYAFDEQYLELKRVFSKYRCLKKILETLIQENDTLKYQVVSLKENLARVTKENEKILQEESNDLKSENIDLKRKVDSLTQDLARFTQGKRNLDILLGSQRCCFNKSGIGYDSFNDQKSYSYMITKSSPSFTLCNFCGKSGHISHVCPSRKKSSRGIKFVWIRKDRMKETGSNAKGPKKIWVPKGKT